MFCFQYKGFRGEKIHAVGHGIPLRKIYDSVLKPNEEQSQPLPNVSVTLTAKQQAKDEKKKNTKVIERSPVKAKKISPLIVQSTPKVTKEKPSDDDGNSRTKKRKRQKSESVNIDDDDAESSSASVTELKTSFEKRMKKFQGTLPNIFMR